MSKRRTRNRVNATGRNSTSRFARLDYRILNSGAYRALNPNERSLLCELLMIYNGRNNGSLYLSVRDAACRMGVVDLTAASRAFETLQRLGFIQMSEDAYFHVKASEKSRARCWRLTWLAGPGRKAPSWEFLEREPEPKSKARKRMERGLRALKAYRKGRDSGKFPVLDSDIGHQVPTPISAEPVLDSDTKNGENGSFLPIRNVSESGTHIATPRGAGANGQFINWWEPGCVPLVCRWIIASFLSELLIQAIHERKTV